MTDQRAAQQARFDHDWEAASEWGWVDGIGGAEYRRAFDCEFGVQRWADWTVDEPPPPFYHQWNVVDDAGNRLDHLIMGVQPGDGFDVIHVDGDPLNCTRANLRVVLA